MGLGPVPRWPHVLIFHLVRGRASPENSRPNVLAKAASCALHADQQRKLSEGSPARPCGSGRGSAAGGNVPICGSGGVASDEMPEGNQERVWFGRQGVEYEIPTSSTSSYRPTIATLVLYNCSEFAGLTNVIFTLDRCVCLSFSREISTTTVSKTEMSTFSPSGFGTAKRYCSAS